MSASPRLIGSGLPASLRGLFFLLSIIGWIMLSARYVAIAKVKNIKNIFAQAMQNISRLDISYMVFIALLFDWLEVKIACLAIDARHDISHAVRCSYVDLFCIKFVHGY